MNQRSSIVSILVNVVAKDPWNLSLSADELESLLEVPKDRSHGDWAFPCFTLAKQLRKGPPVIAKELHAQLVTNLSAQTAISSVEAEGPYLNFKLNKAELAATLIPEILEGSFLLRRTPKAERVMIEYSNPNTHKAFHVGHLRNASLGDSLARLYDWSGFDVVPVNYIGDEGAHVAKCLWLYTKVPNRVPPAEYRGEYLGKFYSDAVEKLDLGLLSNAPVDNVKAAKIISQNVHPTVPAWTVVELESSSGKHAVVTGAKGAKVGDFVPYVEIGTFFNGKKIEISDKKGTKSEGVILSEKEIGISENNDLVAVLPLSAKIGDDIAELYRIPGVIDENIPVLTEIKNRQAEVSKVLQALESEDPQLKQLWLETRQWSLDELHENYKWLDCTFSHDFTESEVGEESRKLVMEFYEKGIFVKSDGAIGADLTEFGLGFCVLIRRDGTAMYAARDLALARKKFEQFGVDRSIYVVDVQQTLHFQQVFKCLELIGYKQVSKCYHLSYGMVVLPEGKMSSRKGTVILFSQLKERLLSKMRSEFLDKYIGDWPEDEIAVAAHRISLGTMRYGMLYQDNKSNIIFDLDAWTSRTGNTGPYIMYAYARTRSILREVGVVDRDLVDWSLLVHETEQDLLQFLSSYQEMLERAAEHFAPNMICAYVYDLAKKFSRMYKNCSVLNAETAQLQATRLSVVEATGFVIQHGLGLLGISTLERM